MKETGKKKEKGSMAPVAIVLSVISLAAIFMCIGLAFLLIRANGGFLSKKEEPNEDPEEILYTQPEVDEMIGNARMEGESSGRNEVKEYIRSEAESPAPNLGTILRNLFPENVVFPGDGRYYFEDISEAYPANPYLRENYVTEENGYRYYREGEVDMSMVCIDVSAHQGSIDWQAVSDSGVGACMLRTGYRGYGSGKMVEDEYIRGNLEGAKVNGVRTGVYFFSQAIDEEEIDEEVSTILELVAPYEIMGPIAIDVEKLDADTARGNTLSREERTALVKRFCAKIKEAGYEPMIYGNAYSLFHMMDYSEISEYKIWYAYYSDTLYFPYDLTMWQYSSTGKVPGISGNVDLNILYEIPTVTASN